MNKFCIDNQQGYTKDITKVKEFKEFLYSEDILAEHLLAQQEFINNGHPDHTIQPIIVSIPSDKFKSLVVTIHHLFPGFSINYFLNRNIIPIYINNSTLEVVRIVDVDNMN